MNRSDITRAVFAELRRSVPATVSDSDLLKFTASLVIDFAAEIDYGYDDTEDEEELGYMAGVDVMMKDHQERIVWDERTLLFDTFQMSKDDLGCWRARADNFLEAM